MVEGAGRLPLAAVVLGRLPGAGDHAEAGVGVVQDRLVAGGLVADQPPEAGAQLDGLRLPRAVQQHDAAVEVAAEHIGRVQGQADVVQPHGARGIPKEELDARVVDRGVGLEGDGVGTPGRPHLHRALQAVPGPGRAALPAADGERTGRGAARPKGDVVDRALGQGAVELGQFDPPDIAAGGRHVNARGRAAFGRRRGRVAGQRRRTAAAGVGPQVPRPGDGLLEPRVDDLVRAGVKAGHGHAAGRPQGVSQVEVQLVVPPVVAVMGVAELVRKIAVAHQGEGQAEAHPWRVGAGELQGTGRDLAQRVVVVAVGDVVQGRGLDHGRGGRLGQPQPVAIVVEHL